MSDSGLKAVRAVLRLSRWAPQERQGRARASCACQCSGTPIRAEARSQRVSRRSKVGCSQCVRHHSKPPIKEGYWSSKRASSDGSCSTSLCQDSSVQRGREASSCMIVQMSSTKRHDQAVESSSSSVRPQSNTGATTAWAHDRSRVLLVLCSPSSDGRTSQHSHKAKRHT